MTSKNVGGVIIPRMLVFSLRILCLHNWCLFIHNTQRGLYICFDSCYDSVLDNQVNTKNLNKRFPVIKRFLSLTRATRRCELQDMKTLKLRILPLNTLSLCHIHVRPPCNMIQHWWSLLDPVHVCGGVGVGGGVSEVGWLPGTFPRLL